MIVGMDFGTTNSGMAVYDGHQLRLVPLDPANASPHVARTALYITNDGTVYIGRGAVNTYYEQNLNRPFRLERVRVGEVELTFAEVGTFIRDVYIEKDVFSPGRLFLSFKMGLSSPTYLGTVVGTQYYFLEDIITVYLYTAKRRAEAFLGRELDSIVLGRPVRFSDDQTQDEIARQRLLSAAFRAGYKTVYLQYEPIAAAYHYETLIDREQNVLIFDFGGGTLDISIVRLGSPKTREVLATGGIPIAGDVFDQKIVRGKFPPHFGEGTTFRGGSQELRVPNTYYEAFSSWQDLLALQLPDQLERLRHIERTASAPLKIKALIQLIASQYGLKVFDIAENAKRQLSAGLSAPLRLQGPGFSVLDVLRRSEFERMIGPEIRAIAERLDGVIRESGLRREQIDAVIRTGGSSQIPAFIDMLNERFGADKVRDVDTFSSVTSGLGIIARQIENGEFAPKAYHAQQMVTPEYLQSRHQGGIPVVAIDLIRKLIDIREGREEDSHQQIVALCQTTAGRFAARLQDRVPEHEVQVGAGQEADGLFDLLRPDERLVLMTTDYRFMLKSAQQLAELQSIGTTLEALENFHSDAFGQETVCATARWETLQEAPQIAMLTTRGYLRVMPGPALLSSLDQSVPYRMKKARGYPAALLPMWPGGELLILTHNGRALRMETNALELGEVRLMNIPANGRVIGAFCLQAPVEILVATAAGYAKRTASSCVPLAAKMGSAGHKIVNRADPAAALVFQPGRSLYALTTRRQLAVQQQDIPLLHAATTPYKLFRPRKGEALTGLAYLPD